MGAHRTVGDLVFWAWMIGFGMGWFIGMVPLLALSCKGILR